MSDEIKPMLPLEDIGFVAPNAARHQYRFRLDSRETSIASSRRSIANLLQLINHRVQQDGNEGPVGDAGIDLLSGYRKGVIAHRAFERIGCHDMREDELLESVDAILQFLELVLRNSGHGGESQAVADASQLISAADVAHRLSEIQK